MAALNIAALARRTGVAPDTLRKWELRYGILNPERTKGGQRRYSELDVARVAWLRDRLTEGYRIGEAAALLGVETEATSTPAELRRALYEAARATEVDELGRLLEQAFALHDPEQALNRVVTPLLEKIGEGWASGELSVAQEHLVSEAVRARLERMLADARGGVRGVAVLACVPGERHELGLLMLATLLRADGWQVAYLGADTPLDDAVALAERLAPSMLCLSATMRDHVRGLRRVALRADVQLVIGGPGATKEAATRLSARYLDSTLARSVRELRRLAA